MGTLIGKQILQKDNEFLNTISQIEVPQEVFFKNEPSTQKVSFR